MKSKFFLFIVGLSGALSTCHSYAMLQRIYEASSRVPSYMVDTVKSDFKAIKNDLGFGRGNNSDTPEMLQTLPRIIRFSMYSQGISLLPSLLINKNLEFNYKSTASSLILLSGLYGVRWYWEELYKTFPQNNKFVSNLGLIGSGLKLQLHCFMLLTLATPLINTCAKQIETSLNLPVELPKQQVGTGTTDDYSFFDMCIKGPIIEEIMSTAAMNNTVCSFTKNETYARIVAPLIFGLFHYQADPRMWVNVVANVMLREFLWIRHFQIQKKKENQNALLSLIPLVPSIVSHMVGNGIGYGLLRLQAQLGKVA